MKIEILQKIIKNNHSKKRFSVLTNLTNNKSEIFEYGNQLSNDFKIYQKEIENYYKLKKNGFIDGTKIFIYNYSKPLEVIIVGAVHIAKYIIDFSKNLNFSIIIIDPRKFFTNNQKFKHVKIINEWPEKILKEMKTDTDSALITLSHDPKIDDPALEYALRNKFYYIGALGSKKTHIKRCQRLKISGYSEKEIKSIHGPIGINLGGKSAPEIALSIIAQLVFETNKLNN